MQANLLQRYMTDDQNEIQNFDNKDNVVFCSGKSNAMDYEKEIPLSCKLGKKLSIINDYKIRDYIKSLKYVIEYHG